MRTVQLLGLLGHTWYQFAFFHPDFWKHVVLSLFPYPTFFPFVSQMLGWCFSILQDV